MKKKAAHLTVEYTLVIAFDLRKYLQMCNFGRSHIRALEHNWGRGLTVVLKV